MKVFPGLGLKVAFVVMLLALGGCATFSVDDAYRPSGKKDYIEMVEGDALLRVSFAPETKFFSVGVLVPVIPLGASMKRGNEVELKLLAVLPAGLPFSFAPVCLEAPPSRLCPKEVHIDNVYYNSRYSPMRPRETWTIDPTAPIAAQDIFDHHPFDRDGAWERMQLELTYLYVCESLCPDEISLVTDDLLRLQGKKIGAGVQQFRWRRKADFVKEIIQ